MKKVYLIATIVAIIAGFATYFFALEIEEKTTIKDAPTQNVVVSLQEIPANTVITKEMVTLKRYTVDSVVTGTATTLEEVIGKMVKYPLVAGEQVILNKTTVVGANAQNTNLSVQLEKDEYAYTMTVGLEESVANYIREGDYVDVLLSYNTNGGTIPIIPIIVMKNIKVIKLSGYSADKAAQEGTPVVTYADVTFVLDKEEVMILTTVRDMGPIRLLLKSIVQAQEEKAASKEEGAKPSCVADVIKQAVKSVCYSIDDIIINPEKYTDIFASGEIDIESIMSNAVTAGGLEGDSAQSSAMRSFIEGFVNGLTASDELPSAEGDPQAILTK